MCQATVWKSDGTMQSSFLEIQHTVSINSLRIATVIFGEHYGILKFDINTLELEDPVLLNILNGTDPIVHKGKFYFIDQAKFVRIYHPSTDNTQKISAVDIGFNDQGKLIPVGDSIYYTRVWNGDADLRTININTLNDTYFDKGSTVFMSNYSPVIYRFNNRMLYTKATDAEGREWWVYEPENTSSIQFETRTNHISAYANPGSDILIIESESEHSGRLHIYDGLGATIYSIPTLLSGKSQVDISGIPSGVYYAHFSSIDGGNSLARFIKY